MPQYPSGSPHLWEQQSLGALHIAPFFKHGAVGSMHPVVVGAANITLSISVQNTIRVRFTESSKPIRREVGLESSKDRQYPWLRCAADSPPALWHSQPNGAELAPGPVKPAAVDGEAIRPKERGREGRRH